MNDADLHGRILTAINEWHDSWATPDFGGSLHEDDRLDLAKIIFTHLTRKQG